MRTIRKPRLSEVAKIKKLLDGAAKHGEVLQRPLMELYENARDFYTYVDENGIGGCCALHIDAEDLAEIRSLVVREDLRGQRIGIGLLDACLDEARRLGIPRIYALTRNQSFFEKQGFHATEKHELPHKVFNDCVKCPLFPDCDEVAMVRELGDTKPTAETSESPIAGTLGFLGYGNMGAAIVQGLISTATITPGRTLVYDVLSERRAAAAQLGVAIAASPAELAKGSDILVLAVKPQTMAEALDQLRPGLEPKTLIVSIAAGISIAFLQERLGRETRVIRVMPNTPALVMAGAAGFAPSSNCTECDEAAARAIFEAIGIAVMVSEDRIDAITALSGSGPAYFFYMVECLVDAAVTQGLPKTEAEKLAGQTLFGAGRLLIKSGESAALLRDRVTSKGGTTAVALETLRNAAFAEIVAAAVAAAAARSKELGK